MEFLSTESFFGDVSLAEQSVVIVFKQQSIEHTVLLSLSLSFLSKNKYGATLTMVCVLRKCARCEYHTVTCLYISLQPKKLIVVLSSTRTEALALAMHAKVLTINILRETGLKTRLCCVQAYLGSIQTEQFSNWILGRASTVGFPQCFCAVSRLKVRTANPCFRTQSMTNVFL